MHVCCCDIPTRVVLALALIVAVLPFALPSTFYLRIAALVFIFSLAVVGLNLLMGFAGQVSLGHAGFFGIGAYAVAVGPTHFGIPSWRHSSSASRSRACSRIWSAGRS